MTDDTAARAEFRLLGPLEVSVDDTPVTLGPPKQRALLVALLMRAGEAVSVEELIDELWPENPPETARHAVQVYVSRLRRGLGDPNRIVARGRAYALRVEPEELDMARFRSLVDRGRAQLADDADSATALLAEALALWRGRTLADLGDEPAVRDVVLELEQERLDALELRLQADLARGKHAEVIGELERLLGEHPARETLYAHLMLALYRAGRQVDALEVYTRARSALREELGLEPGPLLRGLQAAILRQDSSLTIEPPELRARRHLPAQPNLLVGREAELRELTELLSFPCVRIVTLVGPGGIGKTRLALAVAERLAGSFRDGVWFVGLDAITDPALVPATVALALGVREQPARSLEETLAEYLHERELLLVADTLEHLLDASSSLAALLRQAPRAKLLATSRTRLDLYGEHVYDVPGLAVPGEQERNAEALERVDSVALFIDRARAAERQFAFTDANGRTIGRICAELEGIPLSIELSAARLRSLSLDQVVAGLGARLELLRGGSRDVPARQRALDTTIEWSYDLLTQTEREVFERLGVFPAAFAIEPASGICGADRDVLNRLAERSLLRADGENPGRFRMLDTIRAFALDRLAAGGRAAKVRTRHAEFFAHLAAETAATSEEAVIERLEEHVPDVRAALEWLYGNGELERAAALALDLTPLAEQAGYVAEGRRWLEPAVRSVANLAPQWQWRVLNGAARLASLQSDMGTAKALADESLSVCRELGDSVAEATVLAFRSWFALASNELADAERLGEEAVSIARLTRDLETLLIAVIAQQVALTTAGKLRRGRKAANEALDLARTMGAARWIVMALGNLCYVEIAEGRFEDAIRHGREALHTRTIDRRAVAVVQTDLAIAELLSSRRRSECAELLREALAFFSDVGDLATCGELIETVSAFVAAEGRNREAATLAGAADTLYAFGGVRFMSAILWREVLAPARAAFGENEWDRAAAEGRSLTPKQAIQGAFAATAVNVDD